MSTPILLSTMLNGLERMWKKNINECIFDASWVSYVLTIIPWSHEIRQ